MFATLIADANDTCKIFFCCLETFNVVLLSSVLVLTGGNSDSRFEVERSSGTIIIAGALDAKRQSNYNLTVEATDGTRSIRTQVLYL